MNGPGWEKRGCEEIELPSYWEGREDGLSKAQSLDDTRSDRLAVHRQWNALRLPSGGEWPPSHNPLDSRVTSSTVTLTQTRSTEGQTGRLHVACRAPEHRVLIPLGYRASDGVEIRNLAIHISAERPCQGLSCSSPVFRSRKQNVRHWLWATGFSRSHRVTLRRKQRGKQPIFPASKRCAACLHRLLAPHHKGDKMLFSFQRCAQVPIQMNIIHTLLSKHCEVFKGWLNLWHCCFISPALLARWRPPSYDLTPPIPLSFSLHPLHPCESRYPREEAIWSPWEGAWQEPWLSFGLLAHTLGWGKGEIWLWLPSKNPFPACNDWPVHIGNHSLPARLSPCH